MTFKTSLLTLTALAFISAPALAAGGPPKELDADGDGKISKKEHLAFAEKRFDEMDKNKDGFIAKDETDAMRAEAMKKMEALKAKMKAEADKKK